MLAHYAPGARLGSAAGDIVAGIGVACVLVPQSLAYAQLAGMPDYRGLYAAALPPLAAALLASSPYLQTGPVALTSILTFGALSSLATPGSTEYIGLGVILALLVGAMRVAIGLCRAGVVAYFISEPMLLGFVPAAAIVIVVLQVPAVFGLSSSDPASPFRSAASALQHPSGWDLAAVGIAGVSLCVMVVTRRVNPLVPGAFLAVAIGIGFSVGSTYDGPTVGAIPSSVIDVPGSLPWADLPALLLSAGVIALVGFVEPSSIARRYAAIDRKRWDANREFLSQGVANLASAGAGGFPVGGSSRRSALNRGLGARTRASGAITGIAVLLFLPFAFLLEDLPDAVLAAIVIASVAGLIQVRPIARLGQYSRPQLLVASVTFALTIALAPHVERAIIAGVVMAVAVHLWRELRLELTSWIENRQLHVRPRGVLYFGTGQRLEDGLLRVVAENQTASVLVLHLDGLGRIDLTGALALRNAIRDLREGGLQVDIVDVRARWRPLVERVVERPDDPLRYSRR